MTAAETPAWHTVTKDVIARKLQGNDNGCKNMCNSRRKQRGSRDGTTCTGNSGMSDSIDLVGMHLAVTHNSTGLTHNQG